MSKRSTQLALAGIIALAAFLRWFRLGRLSFFFDELYNVWANKMSLGGMLNEQLAAGHPPLYYLFARAWYALGTGEVWTRSMSALIGMCTVAFVYLAARELFSERAGLWAGAFAAASPLLIWYSRANTYYSFLIAAGALSFWLLARASIRGGWGNWIAYTLAGSALLFSYFYGFVLIASGWLFYLFIGRRDRQSVIPWLLSQGALLAVTGATYLMSSSATAEPHRLGIPGFASLKLLVYDFTIAPIVLVLGKVDAGINYSGAEGLPLKHVAAFVAVVLAAEVLYVAAGWFRDLVRERRVIAVAVFVFLLVAGPLMLQLINGGSLSGRFYVWAAPVLLILAASVVAATPARVGWAFGGILLAGLVGVSLWEINVTSNDDADWRSLMGTVSANQKEGDRLAGFALSNVEIAADYYLTQSLPVTGGFPAGSGEGIYFLPKGESWGGYKSGYFVGSGASPALTGGQLDLKLREEFAGAERLWLVDQSSLLSPGVRRVVASGWVEKGRWDYAPSSWSCTSPVSPG